MAYKNENIDKTDFILDPNESLDYIDFEDPGGYTEDFVPDAQTAYKLAMIYIESRFGAQQIDAQKPYHISKDEKMGLWMVRGTCIVDKDATGGGAIDIVIRIKDGKVMLMAAEA